MQNLAARRVVSITERELSGDIGREFLIRDTDPPMNSHSLQDFCSLSKENQIFTCSFSHLDFVKEFPRFGRKISANIG